MTAVSATFALDQLPRKRPRSGLPPEVLRWRRVRANRTSRNRRMARRRIAAAGR